MVKELLVLLPLLVLVLVLKPVLTVFLVLILVQIIDLALSHFAILVLDQVLALIPILVRTNGVVVVECGSLTVA